MLDACAGNDSSSGAARSRAANTKARSPPVVAATGGSRLPHDRRACHPDVGRGKLALLRFWPVAGVQDLSQALLVGRRVAEIDGQAGRAEASTVRPPRASTCNAVRGRRACSSAARLTPSTLRRSRSRRDRPRQAPHGLHWTYAPGVLRSVELSKNRRRRPAATTTPHHALAFADRVSDASPRTSP